jgi:hypothetical protein
MLVHDANVRDAYTDTAKGVLTEKGQWSPVRAFAKVEARASQSGIGSGVVALAEKSAEGVPKGFTGTSTNAAVNTFARGAKTAGGVAIGISVGISAYDAATAPKG